MVENIKNLFCRIGVLSVVIGISMKTLIDGFTFILLGIMLIALVNV